MLLSSSSGVCEREGKILRRLTMTNKICRIVMETQRTLNSGIYLYNQRNCIKVID